MNNTNRSLKLKQSQSLRYFGLAAGLTLAVLLLFQNCSDMPEEKKDNASLGDSLPFPFETDIDTISYMSCSRTGNSVNPRAYYTFRVGAYQTGGIGLTSGFLSQTGSAAQRSDILQATTTNSGSFLQLSIRQRNRYQTVLGGSSGVQEGHYYNFLDSLNAPVIGDRLGELKTGQKVNYFSGISGLEGKMVEGSINFFDGETQSGDVRRYLLNDMVLAMTYSSNGSGSEPYTARAPDMTDVSKVFGKGYKVGFRLWGSTQTGLNRVLQSVTEMNLETGANINNSWSCDATNAYVIVRAQDVPGACGAAADPLPSQLSATNRARLEKIRRVLRVEDWWVDLSRNCVVPKNNPSGSGGACYGTGAAAQTSISYAVGATNSGVTSCDASTCPHYVSVCTR